MNVKPHPKSSMQRGICYTKDVNGNQMIINIMSDVLKARRRDIGHVNQVVLCQLMQTRFLGNWQAVVKLLLLASSRTTHWKALTLDQTCWQYLACVRACKMLCAESALVYLRFWQKSGHNSCLCIRELAGNGRGWNFVSKVLCLSVPFAFFHHSIETF